MSLLYVVAVPDKLLMLSGVLCVWLRRCGGGHSEYAAQVINHVSSASFVEGSDQHPGTM